MERISENFWDNVRRFDQVLGVGRSCDVVSRDFFIGGRRSRIWVIDGYGKDEVLERIGAFWLSVPAGELEKLTAMQDFIDRFVTFSETNVSFDPEDIVTRAWRDARRGKDVSKYGFIARFQAALTKILPHSLVMDVWMAQQGLE